MVSQCSYFKLPKWNSNFRLLSCPPGLLKVTTPQSSTSPSPYTRTMQMLVKVITLLFCWNHRFTYGKNNSSLHSVGFIKNQEDQISLRLPRWQIGSKFRHWQAPTTCGIRLGTGSWMWACACVKLWRAAVCRKFPFGRQGVMPTQPYFVDSETLSDSNQTIDCALAFTVAREAESKCPFCPVGWFPRI